MSHSPSDDFANEKALVAAALSGDNCARKLLIERYLQFVRCRVALQFPMPLREAQIVKQTFISAWRELSTWSAEIPLCSWLAKIASDRIGEELQRLRRRPRLNPLTQAILRTLQDDLEKGDAEKMTERFACCVERLPDDGRAILQQKYRDHFSTREIAEMGNESESFTAQRLFRIRQFLCASLAANGGEVEDAE